MARKSVRFTMLLCKSWLIHFKPAANRQHDMEFWLSVRFWISLCWVRSTCNTEKSLFSFGLLLSNFSFMKRRATPCYVLSVGNQQNGPVSPIDLSIHILAISKVVSLCCADVHHPSLADCSSSLRCLKLSLIRRCFGWTCRRQELSFRETLFHRGQQEYISDWN